MELTGSERFGADERSLGHGGAPPCGVLATSARRLHERFGAARALTARLAQGLSPEDQTVQSMPEASPTKWHLAHTTWFFETFVLGPYAPGYRPFHPRFHELFNSYYEAVGARHPRPQRGLLSRPTTSEVARYRAHVDEAVNGLLRGDTSPELAARIELGVQHEEQHQELVLTDILHAFASSPLRPSYRAATGIPGASGGPGGARAAPPASWQTFHGGVFAIGHPGTGFGFDNEFPRHEVLLRPFSLASRPVTCGEWKEFIARGGYERPEFWLSDGWTAAREQGWRAPLYWEEAGADWQVMTLDGPRPVDDAAPVCHVSFYEADAFARSRGARLPTEAEWEVAARSADQQARDLQTGALRPLPAKDEPLAQLLGDVWEWTASPYTPYPGYAPPSGAIGEYNGKFMCNQMVLRGGSALTPRGHARPSYRNFFYPNTRWQMAGVRLAAEVSDA